MFRTVQHHASEFWCKNKRSWGLKYITEEFDVSEHEWLSLHIYRISFWQVLVLSHSNMKANKVSSRHIWISNWWIQDFRIKQIKKESIQGFFLLIKVSSLVYLYPLFPTFSWLYSYLHSFIQFFLFDLSKYYNCNLFTSKSTKNCVVFTISSLLY